MLNKIKVTFEKLGYNFIWPVEYNRYQLTVDIRQKLSKFSFLYITLVYSKFYNNHLTPDLLHDIVSPLKFDVR